MTAPTPSAPTPPGAPASAPRPRSLMILAVLLVLYAAGSLEAFAGAFPRWLDAAARHQAGAGSAAWVELAGALSALGAALGLWRGRRWARAPFVVFVVVQLAAFVAVALFGVGEAGTPRGWVVTGLLLAGAAGFAIGLTRYVWQHT